MTNGGDSTLDPRTFHDLPRRRDDPYAEPVWKYRPPSRLLRRLYAELERLEGILAWSRARRYVPDSASLDFRCRREACRPYEQRVRELQARIDRAQNR